MAVLGSALTSGATFGARLYRQLEMVEVAASIALAVELYLVSSSVGDWIEEKLEPSKSRKRIANGAGGAVVGHFLNAKRFRSPVRISGFGSGL
jgi:hypothetical protein